jgi:hypothetical protein
MIMESVNFLDHRSYHYSLYQENGKPLKRIDSVQDTTDEFEYFSNGQLKKKLRREANRLNGDFREWDSLGTIQSKLIYRNGFRVKKTVMDSSVTKKREVRHLSAAQKNSINNWVRYSLIKRYPTNSNGTQGIQLSADSVDMMCKDIQRAMSMMPENWFSEIPTFDGEQDVFFRYRFTIRNDGDTIFTKWKELCNLLNLEVVHTDAANGKWLQGEVKSNNFFSPDFIQYQWMVLCKSCPISISVLPFDESKIKLLTNEDKFDQYGDSYISIHYTSLSGVALVQWDTPSGVKLFTLYADDLECFNRDWNWEIPVREVNLMKWD